MTINEAKDIVENIIEENVEIISFLCLYDNYISAYVRKKDCRLILYLSIILSEKITINLYELTIGYQVKRNEVGIYSEIIKY